MATLTVREKEHWKERIVRKIEQASEALLASESPNYRERLGTKAERLAMESLGIAKLNEQLEELAEQDTRIKKEREAIHREMLATACGTADATSYGVGHSSMPYQVAQAIARRRTIHEKDLLAGDELGRKLLALDQEKEELLDAVWLATSGKQIKQLWQKVGELLSQEPTPLQQETLDIGPVEGE